SKAPADQEPPSEPDPLGGTMVGISPFASGAFAAEGARTQSRGTPAPEDFNDNTPAAGSEGAEPSEPVVSGSAVGDSFDVGSGGSDAGAPDNQVSEAGMSDAMLGAGTQAAPLRTNTFEQPRIPVTQSSAGPI